MIARMMQRGNGLSIVTVVALLVGVAGQPAIADSASSKCKPIRVLMLVGGPAHDFEQLPRKLADRLEANGGIRVRITHDVADFNAAALADVDVLMFNCCHKEPPGDAVQRAIVDALAAGKGLVAMHCAFWSFQGWEEWREIIGGVFESHDKFGLVEAAVVDRYHPILRGVPAKFAFQDEAYVVTGRSENEHPLVNSLKVHGGHPTPEAMVWTKRYRGSRVFAILFGHDDKSQLDPVFVTLLRNGIYWSAEKLGPPTLPSDLERKQGFVPLFDGKTLKGWRYDPKYWKVHDGMIVGNTYPDGLDHHTYAITEKQFGDFILRIKAKLVSGNSGVQFRSKVTDTYDVGGYQADVVLKGWGNLHEQYGRRKLVDGWKGKSEFNIDPDGWNDMEVIARGPHVTIKVNGVVTAEWTETQPDVPRTGVIALQLHQGGPMEVRYTDIRIKPLAKCGL